MPKHVDYLIIGQGLAGSLLGWELIKQGCHIHLIDNQTENASQVAAGLINPVTGMRLVKNVDIEYLLPCAQQTYQTLSDFFRQDFYIAQDMLRIVRTQKERLKFEQRCRDQNYLDYLEPELQTPPTSIQAPLGIIRQKNTGYLLTRNLLNCLKDFFQKKQCYQASQFDYQQLQLAPNISYQNIIAKKIIFCEGYQAIHNPWFKYLPFQLAKGEILTLTAAQAFPDKMLNYGRWFIPLGNLQFRTGATFTHDQLDTLPTTQGRQLLLQALTQVVPSLSNATLIKHHANIRPTTLDKAPFIGLHPEYENLGIFNGFGAKGSLQIPYYSQQFVQSLLKQHPLAPGVDCQRINYKSAFYAT
jgi:glycine/D-amino acid oxidase-like deaminating enzyme